MRSDHFQQQDGLITDSCVKNCSTLSSQPLIIQLEVHQLAAFLLAVEQGAILGCDGWDEQFSKPLGDPLGPAVKNGDMLERHFKSGTYVTWDLSNNQSKIVWADSN